MNNEMIIVLVILWFLAGIIEVFLGAMHDMRNMPYNANYLKYHGAEMFYCLVFGLITLIVIIGIIIFDNFTLPKINLTKKLWELANIGVDKDKI